MPSDEYSDVKQFSVRELMKCMSHLASLASSTDATSNSAALQGEEEEDDSVLGSFTREESDN